MRMYDILRDKRDGKALTKEQIDFFVKSVVEGHVPDYQLSALLMAIYINGMTRRETVDLTIAMANSGETVDLSSIKGVKVDKHSTGGVGDKTTLVVVPIVAACGVKVAKMSGKGLGHTGGTIDKLESIQGYKTDLDRERFFEIVNTVGASIIGQSGNLDPADKKMYALRDVTATIESMPLIVSSIMSKKIAAGADAIVLDVKVGSGSFNKNLDYAVELAKQMVDIGKGAGRKVTAVLTNMDIPLGLAIGNSLEVVEAIDTLHGMGPADLTEVALTLAANMLHLSGMGSLSACRQKARQVLYDGSAFKKFVAMVEAHGGNIAPIFDTDIFPSAAYDYEVKSPCDGFVSCINTENLGIASLLLGAGRAKKEDKIDYLAGIILNKKTGDEVKKGDLLATLYASDPSKFEEAQKTFLDSFVFGDVPPKVSPLVLECISSEKI